MELDPDPIPNPGPNPNPNPNPSPNPNPNPNLNPNQAELISALRAVRCTLITAAHRLSAITPNADHVVVFKAAAARHRGLQPPPQRAAASAT